MMYISYMCDLRPLRKLSLKRCNVSFFAEYTNSDSLYICLLFIVRHSWSRSSCELRKFHAASDGVLFGKSINDQAALGRAPVALLLLLPRGRFEIRLCWPNILKDIACFFAVIIFFYFMNHALSKLLYVTVRMFSLFEWIIHTPVNIYTVQD